LIAGLAPIELAGTLEVRKNRPSRRSDRNTFSRIFGGRTSGAVRKAPRRRDVERLEGREMMTATPGTNEYFGNQWYLFANGQLTEFDPTSPTYLQTVAVPGQDINVLAAWAQGLTGAGVQIAIIDGGFDLTHEDLAAAFVLTGLTTQLDQLDGDNSPAFNDISDFLGTALAGIVGAQDNNVGIVGIAHGADIFPIRLTPGAGDANQATIDAINRAFRFQAGFIQDGNADGVPDALLGGALVGIDIDGDGNFDGFTQDPSLVTDVFLHTGSWNVNPNSPRVALDLPTGLSTEITTPTTISILQAITDTALNGRARWIDTNGDGFMTPDEIEALGSIHIVPAGNDGGRINATPPFIIQGDLASSQYDRLANSIYTIAVGAVDYTGQYENPQTGVVSWFSEGGSNVLLVAPSGNFRQDISTNTDLNSGIVTTDITGEGGNNVGPIFNFEYDDDYLPDTNYTSNLGGTEAAAAQVAAVVGLMLEANPNLSYRDVQQILMMSARQNDQFNESWIVNQMQGFIDELRVEIPQYASYAIDTDGDGEADIDAAILPNSEYDPEVQDYLLERGFFLPGNENASVDLGVPFVYAPLPAVRDDVPVFFVDANGDPVLDEFGYTIPRFEDNEGNLLGLAIINPSTGEAYEVVLNLVNNDPNDPGSNQYPVDAMGNPIDITDPQQLRRLRVLVPFEPDGTPAGVQQQEFIELNAYADIPGDPDRVRFAVQFDDMGMPNNDPPADPADDDRPIVNLAGIAVRPIVIKTERFVLPPEPPEGDPAPPQVPPYQQTVIGLLYDPNGNLFRPQAQTVDDENRLAVDDETGVRVIQFAPASLAINGLQLAPTQVQIVGANTQIPNPIVLFQPGTIGDGASAGIGGLVNPIVAPGLLTPLEFENGAGFTVSQGYGYNLEDLSYGHGVLDAGLAVEMAKAWATYDLYSEESVTITTGILRGTGTLRVQPAVNVTLPNGAVIQTVTGGTAGVNQNINADYYRQFFRSIETEEITDSNDNVIGEVITEAPFFNLDDPITSDRGITEIPFNFDPSLFEDYLSVEWLELTTNIAAGDVDHLRMAIRAPDGTVTELNAFRPPVGPALVPQDPQGQQGRFTPAEEALKGVEGFINLNAGGDFINDSVPNQIATVESPDAIGNGVGWTWTTNRHWGELFSSQAQSIEAPPNGGASVADGWTLIIENHGFGEILIGGNLEIAVHGTKATGNRIQGKVGIDDNKQGIQGTNNDENFNFNRYIEFGVYNVQYIDGAGNLQTRTQSFILDDPNDSVTYTNANTPEPGRFSLDNIYKTVAPDTGEELYYPVVNKNTYLGSRTTDQAVFDEIYGTLENFFRLTEGDPNLTIIGATNVSSVDYFTGDSQAIRNATALGFYGEVPNTDIANPVVYRNFDYSQESFAAGVLVTATQYVTTYNLDGEAVGTRAATGKVQNFFTGADGNYYFDVVATPEPPAKPVEADFMTPEEFEFALGVWQAVYNSWFVTYGGITYDYDISIGGDDAARQINNGGDGYFDAPEAETSHGSAVAFNMNNTYTVQMFASENRNFGETSKVTNVNFLLEIDPALTNVPVSGTVFRDRNNDGTQQAGIDESAAGVTVFYDADGNGMLDSGEISAVTDANGNYSLVISGLLSPATVSIGIVESTIPAGLVLQNPLSGFRSVNVSPGQAVDVDFTLRLGIGEPAVATGFVFEDANQNGVRDNGEGPFSESVQVNGQDVYISAYVDLNGNGAYDPSEPTATVRPDGTFVIETSATGNYTVRLNLPSSQLNQTRPANDAGVAVNLVAGQQTTLATQFGVYDGRIFDFGDLYYVEGVYNYPTLLANNGARHVVIPGVRLGMLNDVDSDGFQSPVRNPAIDGLGDDFNGVDDEDGVRLVTATVLPNSTIQFDIMAFGAGAVLNAWFDFNNDGDWNDPGEKIFNNVEDMQVLDPLNPQFRRFTVQTPADVDTSATFYAARFRWGSAGLGYAGVANSGEVEDYLFAATAPIVVSGAVRNDVDGNGVFAPGDAAVAGVRVFFDRNLNGTLDNDEPRAITDATGAYRLEIATTTTQNVTLRLDTSTVPAGLGPLVPIGGIFNQNIAPSSPVTANFLVGAPQGLSGAVFNDLDNDGSRDGNETGLANVVVEVFRDADSNGSFETLVQTTTTDAQGAYNVRVTSVGQYQVRINLGSQQFVSQTAPSGGAGRTVTVVSGAFTTVADFGVHDAVPTFTLDYGDLIVGPGLNYPTLLSDNGARHTRVAGSFLGAIAPDADPGSLQSFNAQADDNLFSPDDEDGVVMASDIVAGSNVLIDVTATGTANDRLHAWIDFNNDGDWLDAGEQITVAGGLALTSGTTTRLVIDTAGIAIDATAAGYAARFRWGQGITGFTGLASTGEVEDYRLPRILGSEPLVDVEGDYNNDGLVTLADRSTWQSSYGSTTNLAADGNGDGVVNSADYTVWREAFDAAQGAPAMIVAPATVPDEFAYLSPLESDAPVALALVTAPPVVTMPIVEDALESVVFDADAFAPMFLASPQVTSILDESLAVDEEEAEAGDAIDAALLQWALGSAADDVDADSEYSFEAAEEEAEEFEEAFASVFAF
jgi:hypothetical protein